MDPHKQNERECENAFHWWDIGAGARVFDRSRLSPLSSGKWSIADKRVHLSAATRFEKRFARRHTTEGRRINPVANY